MITYAIIAVTVIVSVLAFRSFDTMNKLIFWPYAVKREKSIYRFISSGFVHANWTHLFFNMFVLFSFGRYVEGAYSSIFGAKGTFMYLLLYLIGIIISDSPNYFRHKDDSHYRSLGASGAVAAVLFTYILLDPTGSVYLFFVPIPINNVLFAGLYLVYSAYMAKANVDNIGHLAHFTGAIFGLLFTIIAEPRLFTLFIDQLSEILPL